MGLRRVIFIIIVILAIGGIYYFQPYFLTLFRSSASFPSTLNPNPYTLSPSATVYRIGVLPKDFPKEFIPVPALSGVSVRRIVHPGGAEQTSAHYQIIWTIDVLRLFYTQSMDAGHWKHDEQLHEGYATIRATRGIGESLHVVITSITPDTTKVSIVYSL